MVDASRSPSSFLALFPRLSARSPFPHSLARKGIRADPMQRLLLLARFQKVVQGFGAKRWINEHLSRPPLLNATVGSHALGTDNVNPPFLDAWGAVVCEG